MTAVIYKYRPKHSELPDHQRLRAICRSYVNVYKKRNHIEKQPCQRCDWPFAEKHHEDYKKPLDVKWLCRECHLDEHYPDRIADKIAHAEYILNKFNNLEQFNRNAIP